MREAIGSSQILMLIVTIIVVIMTVLSASIGYTKAFKARNTIINIVQQNGSYDRDAETVLAFAEESIDALLGEMGYKEKVNTKLTCSSSDYDNVDSVATGKNYNFCLYEIVDGQNRYYKIKTFMYFELPLFGRNDRFVFPVVGETYSFNKLRGEG